MLAVAYHQSGLGFFWQKPVSVELEV